MVDKPTYEELQQRVKELEEEALECRQSAGVARRIQWLLTRGVEREPSGIDRESLWMPAYGNLVDLNTCRILLDAAGEDILLEITRDYVDMLETSVAVYEKNGDYALGIFSSGWCRLLDQASRNLCSTDNNSEALKSGKWHCHESCWNEASRVAIETGETVDIECRGGIRLYAVPVKTSGEIVGAISFGYGDPPRDQEKLEEISTRYGVNRDELLRCAESYRSRPPYLVGIAKNLLNTSAKLLGEIVDRKRVEQRLCRTERELSIRSRVAEIFLTTPDNEVYGDVLEVVLDALGSKYGTFGYIDQDGNRVVPSLTKEIWDRCGIASKSIFFPRETWGNNIWARCIKEKRSIFSNGPFKFPDGHITVSRVLAVPIIHKDEVVGNFMVGNKATDYDDKDLKLLKTIADRIAPVLAARLQNEIHEKERRRAEEKIVSLARFPSENPNPVLRVAGDGSLLYANAAASLLLDQWGCRIEKHLPEEPCKLARYVFASGSAKDSEVTCGDRIFSLRFTPVRNADYVNIYGMDITERRHYEEQQKQLEAMLQEKQTMEAVGTLAGGIAHNFNNLLMAILGNVSLMLLDLDSMHPHYELLTNVRAQVNKGAALASQLLGYARKGKYYVQTLNLNHLVKKVARTVAAARKGINIHNELADDLLPIEGDQSQVEQVLLNLYMNASDAMPSGGNLILNTANIASKEIEATGHDLNPGNYVRLKVVDTGTGMDEATKRRAFEPFFTTKEVGRGTGLGLAASYGIVKGHGGHIEIESSPGQGSTLTIYLPAKEYGIEDAATQNMGIIKGVGTVLLVDDEKRILRTGARMLERLGYKVLQAESGQEAVEIFKKNVGKIDLVILDIVMPKMDGGETFDKLKEIDVDVKVILSSGYSIYREAKNILARGGDAFIQKPFGVQLLSQKIREVLGKKTGHSPHVTKQQLTVEG